MVWSKILALAHKHLCNIPCFVEWWDMLKGTKPYMLKENHICSLCRTFNIFINCYPFCLEWLKLTQYDNVILIMWSLQSSGRNVNWTLNHPYLGCHLWKYVLGLQQYINGHKMVIHWGFCYRKTSSISRTKSQNLNVSCIVLRLSSLNPSKPGVKLRMKM